MVDSYVNVFIGHKRQLNDYNLHNQGYHLYGKTIRLESYFLCTYREANDFFHKVVEKTAKSNNKRSPLPQVCTTTRNRPYSDDDIIYSSDK